MMLLELDLGEPSDAFDRDDFPLLDCEGMVRGFKRDRGALADGLDEPAVVRQ